MLKHTPGPWYAEHSSNNGWEIKGVLGNCPKLRSFVEFSYSSTKPIKLFVEPWHQFPNAEWNAMTEANARLIAAAPDLLELIQRAICRLDIAHQNGDSIMKEWVIDARSIVKKATEKSS